MVAGYDSCISVMGVFETCVLTGLGPVRIIWSEEASGPKVKRIVLEGGQNTQKKETDSFPNTKPGSNQQIQALASDIRSFLSGKDVSFDMGILAFDRCTPFQEKVLAAEYGIPRGYVSTYGRIACHLGLPAGARAVGNALASNPFPVVIPCHRAVRSDGSLGGFQGGPGMKAALLRMEGITFGKDGRVLFERVWY